MNWHIVSLARAAPQPWKNGGGTTRELLAWPQADGWRVRMSVAEVSRSGPFSVFKGVRRWFAVLGGDGVVLSLHGKEHPLTPASEPFAFDGGVATGCELTGGATQDFNLMTREAPAVMHRVHGAWSGAAGAGSLVAAYAASQPAAVRCGDNEMTLAPGTLAWCLLDAQSTVAIEGADALWMEINP
jgi:environmental stress-induced protein Ves